MNVESNFYIMTETPNEKETQTLLFLQIQTILRIRHTCSNIFFYTCGIHFKKDMQCIHRSRSSSMEKTDLYIRT